MAAPTTPATQRTAPPESGAIAETANRTTEPAGALPPAGVPQTFAASPAGPTTSAPAAAQNPEASIENLRIPTPGGGWRPLSLKDYPNAQALSGGSDKNPAIVLDPSSTTANNAEVLRSTGILSGPAEPQLVQGLMHGLQSSLRPNRPENVPSLVVFRADDALPEIQRPYFLPVQPDTGYAPKSPLPTRVTFGGVTSVSSNLAQFGGEGSITVSSGVTSGRPPEAPNASTDQISTKAFSGRAGYNGGPLGGIGFNTSTTTIKAAGGEPYEKTVRSTGVAAGWSSQGGPSATVAVTQGSQGPDPRYDRSQISVTAGVQATGPMANVKFESPQVSVQAGFNKFDIAGLPVGSFIPGSWGAMVTFRTPDERHHWVLDKASQSLVFYGQGEGNAALTVGAVGVGSVGAPFAIPGPDAVPQRRLQLPPEVIQAINAREQSGISARYLDRRAVQTLAENQTPDLVRAHLFEKASGGVSALGPDGKAKPRQQLEDDLWHKYREQHGADVTPLETAAASPDEKTAKDAQEKLDALRTTALQPIGRLATPLTPTFMPANASVHVFPRGEMLKQTELLKNFGEVTGVSPLKPDGSLKTTEELNGAVWGWFRENNRTLVTALEERAASTDPAVAQDAQRRLQAIRQIALVAVAEPEIPTPEELRTSIRQQQQRELQQSRGASEKPWEQRTERSPIGYRRPYDNRFSVDAGHSVRTTTIDGKPTATSRITLEVATPDANTPLSPRAQRTGIADTPLKTFGVTYEQQVALSSQVPAIVTRHQIKQDLKAHETELLKQFHKSLSAAARQGISVDQTAESLISTLPIREMTPRGEVTSQQLSIRTPEGTLGLRASHSVEVITPPSGTPFAVAQIVLETNRSGSPRSIATWEQRVPLDPTRSPEAASATIRAQLYRSIVGEGQFDGILQTATRNGLAAVSSGKPLPEQLAPGFVPLAQGQSAQERGAALITTGATTPTEQAEPASSTRP